MTLDVGSLAGVDAPATALQALQFGGFLGQPLWKLLVVVLAIAIVVFVGRMVLRIAWRLVTIAAVILAVLLLVSFFVPGLLG